MRDQTSKSSAKKKKSRTLNDGAENSGKESRSVCSLVHRNFYTKLCWHTDL